MKIRTDPPGAVVVVNDEEIGVSPVKFSFTWYGDYEIMVRKEGYQSLHTHYRVDPPWYQIPPIDFVTEVLVARTIRDVHELPTFTLEPAEKPTLEQITERAVETRERALSESGMR